MDKKKYNEALKQAFIKKYGLKVTKEPLENWTLEKEKDYLEQLKLFVEQEDEYNDKVVQEVSNGVSIVSKLVNRKNKIIKCPKCNVKCKTVTDDVYMIKHDCCEKCYINYIEGRNIKNED